MHTLKKAAVSSRNVRTQDFLVSVNNLATQASSRFIAVTAFGDFASMTPVVQTDDRRIEEVSFLLCESLCSHFEMLCPKWQLEVGWGLMKVEFLHCSYRSVAL